MRTLSATELLDVWERGERQHPLDRALTLLGITCPEKKFPELAHLSIGQRDALLLALRQLTLGPHLEAYTECPSCGAQQEFTVDIRELLQQKSLESEEQTAKIEGFLIRFRLPDSFDLATCINLNLTDGNELLKRCVLSITRRNKAVAFEDLPETASSAMEEKIAETDPLSEVNISLDCFACGCHLTMVLDILSFLWEELREQAKRLLNQVHVLARYYGWREADILSMSPWRRQYYLEMVA